MIVRTAIVFVGLSFATAASAQTILKNEPPNGMLRTGEVVYVDNGKCPKGQVQKVSGGSYGNRNGTGGVGRQKECVPRPAP